MTVALKSRRNHAPLFVAACDRWACPWTSEHFSDNVVRARLRAHVKADHPPIQNVPLPFD